MIGFFMTAPAPTALFDLDGTLVDTAGDLTAALNVALKAGNAEPVSVDQVRTMIGQGARKLIERGFALAKRDFSADEFEDLVRLFLDYYRANIDTHSVLYPHALTMLDQLEDAGVRLAICTNKPEDMAIALMDSLGHGDRFAMIAGGDTHAVNKPDPGHLTLTLEAIGGDPERVVMIGDSFADVEAARRAGYPCIGVSFGYTDTPMRELGPDFVIDTLSEIWSPAQQLLKL
jgi:phosphoglycolate phosphatase